jgi:soluble lytic murein transglycosylase-like protein
MTAQSFRLPRSPGLRLWTAAVILIVSGIAGVIGHGVRIRPHREATSPPPKPLAPPDLEKLREPFISGMEALQRGDGNAAVGHFSSFNFGSRAVEQYRLYFLGQGYQLAGNRAAARAILARLWSSNPAMVYSDDIGFNIGLLYADVADWHQAAAADRTLAERANNSALAAAARWRSLENHFCDDDPAAVLEAARSITIQQPSSAQAGAAIGVIRSLSRLTDLNAIHLTVRERVDRAVALLRDGDSQHAFDELSALDHESIPEDLRPLIALNKGIALCQLRRYEDSNRLLEPLSSGSYRYAIPAIYHASKNYRALAASINPVAYKAVVVKKRPNARVQPKGGKRRATTPRRATVRRRVPTVDLAKKTLKDSYDHRSVERMTDLLGLPLARPVRIEVLKTLIAIAESKEQDPYEQRLVAQLVAVDPLADTGLQHFWDKAWAAYTRGDLAVARDLFGFIARTYGNPNARRQSEYWYARAVERAGRRQEAAAIYDRLASAPYDDLYALNARARGSGTAARPVNPFEVQRPDWPEIAEKEMPQELRLAYELNALSQARDARIEIQNNTQTSNQRFADALLADLYYSGGSLDLAYRYARRAFPELATPEQNVVPPYFLKMYFSMKYESTVRHYSDRNQVDPCFVMALIHQESAFSTNARSAVGAIGLMQLMPATGQELGSRLFGAFRVARLEEPETNIAIGTFHLHHLFQLFNGNEQIVAAAYNAGQGNVMRWRRHSRRPMDEFLESIPFPETRNYVKRVTMLTSSYRVFNQ